MAGKTHRGRRILGYSFLTLILLAGGMVVSMRILRHGHKPVEEVRAGVFRARNFFTELYGARVGDKVLLFDAGVDPEGGALDALLEAMHTDRDGVTDIFLTHGHFDHIAAAPLCKKARIHLGIQDADMAAQKAPFAPAVPRLLARVLPVPPVNLTDAILQKGELPFGDKQVMMLPTPGHTPGSYMFLFSGVLFAGDTIKISDGKLTFGDKPTCVDFAELKRSVAGLKAQLGTAKFEQICTGHQGCTPVGDAAGLLDDLIERAKHS
jgi:glyoxylase-like metal-dependent hydrolase (beta-lactamase superfamily II)